MRRRDSRDVVITDDESRMDVEDVEVTESQTRFAPAQLVHAAIGVFLVVLGIVAMVRGDLNGDLTEPGFEVLSITHSAAVGIGELATGALLLLAAAGPSGRFLGLVVGLFLVVLGAFIVADDGVREDLGTETALGWLAIVLGAAAVLAALIPSRRVRRRNVSRSAVA
jgi:predicted transporter